MKNLLIAAYVPLLFLVGCVTTVDDSYYLPHPGLAEIPATQPSAPPVVTAFGTIVGIQWPDDARHVPAEISARLRIHNNSAQNVSFDPRSIDLTTGDLVQFPPPALNPAMPVQVAPGQSVTISADFPFPAGRSPDQLDLSSLQLRWVVNTGATNAEQTITFQRHWNRPYYHYDPYWDAYPYGYGYGYPYPVLGGEVIIRHR